MAAKKLKFYAFLIAAKKRNFYGEKRLAAKKRNFYGDKKGLNFRQK